MSFSGKIRTFYRENKQTSQLIFSFLVTLTKMTDEKWNGMWRNKINDLKLFFYQKFFSKFAFHSLLKFGYDALIDICHFQAK